MTKRFFVGLVGSVLLNIATWVVVIWFIPRQEGGTVIPYNIYFGIDSVGQWSELLTIPITGLVIVVLNTVLSLLYSKKAALLSTVLEISSLAIQAVLFVAAVLLISVNTI